MDKTVKVLFTDKCEIERGNGKPNVVFQAGKEYDLREDRARYWVDRGMAEMIGADGKIIPKAAKPMQREQYVDFAPKASARGPIDFSALNQSKAFLNGD